MTQYFELGVKVAAMPVPTNPYAGAGGRDKFMRHLGTLTGFKVPTPSQPANPLASSTAAMAKAPQAMGPTARTQPFAATPASPPASTPAGQSPGMLNSTAFRRYDAYASLPVAASAAAAGMHGMGMRVPPAMRRFSGYRPGRSWAGYGKSFLNPKAWLPTAGRAGTGLSSKVLPFVPYAMEGLDAAGALPEWAGGDGMGNVGWSDPEVFKQQTSMGEAGDTLGYKGPGWQALNSVGASLNSSATPIRSNFEIARGVYDINNLMPKALAGKVYNSWREKQLADARQNKTPFTAADMNQMAKNQGGFYHDQQLGHMMPTSAYFGEGTAPEDEIWRQRVLGAAGSSAWQPGQ